MSKTAKLFRNGRSQAVRLPREFRFEDDEVLIRARVQAFLSGPISLLSWDDEDAKEAGAIRATLELAGRPIGAYDLLIAGQAVRHKLTLITSNAREFGRVKGLSWEDWAKS